MIPRPRAVWLAAVSIVPAAVALLAPWVAPVLIAFDVLVLVAIVADFLLAPRASALRVRRIVEPVFSSGRANVVRIELRAQSNVRGEFRDLVTPGPLVEGHHQVFAVSNTFEYRVTPSARGDLELGPLNIRTHGPLGLASRQFTVKRVDHVKVMPDLAALTQDALTLARAEQATARVKKIRAEGREFESLREYRAGDDRRVIDWKATARRGKPLVRLYQPEKNQQVVLLLDCGRHMAGLSEGRRKIDHAVDATLRLAKVAIDQGDLVGVLAFGRDVKVWLPPRKGAAQLRAIAQALYRVEAALEESDYGAALDTAFARSSKRSLVVVLTDLLDPENARTLLLRTRKLVPRHLPLIASLQDPEVHATAVAEPMTVDDAYARFTAGRLERDTELTVARLREGGARVVRGTPASFAAASVNAYLDVKSRGLL
ncbi:MAG: DUF58 domain-containing protein [Archangium sp.]